MCHIKKKYKQLTDHVLRENVKKMFQAFFMHTEEHKN